MGRARIAEIVVNTLPRLRELVKVAVTESDQHYPDEVRPGEFDNETIATSQHVQELPFLRVI